jgi:hypothetical protein
VWPRRGVGAQRGRASVRRGHLFSMAIAVNKKIPNHAAMVKGTPMSRRAGQPPDPCPIPRLARSAGSPPGRSTLPKSQNTRWAPPRGGRGPGPTCGPIGSRARVTAYVARRSLSPSHGLRPRRQSRRQSRAPCRADGSARQAPRARQQVDLRARPALDGAGRLQSVRAPRPDRHQPRLGRRSRIPRRLAGAPARHPPAPPAAP